MSRPPVVRRRNADLVLLALVTVGARAIVALAAWASGTDPAVVATPDGRGYLALAAGLRETGTFGVTGPEVLRPPAYPAILALVSLPTWPLTSAIFLNIILSVAVTCVVYLTARTLGGRRAGVGAGALVSLSPELVMWSVSALAETWLALAVAVIGYALLKSRSSGASGRADAWRLVAVAAALAAAYAKIIGYPLAIGLPLAAVCDTSIAWRRRIARAVAGALIAAAVLGAWHVRNGLVSGYWGFSTQFARAALFTVAAGVRAEREGASYASARQHEAAAVGASAIDAAGDERRTRSMWRAGAARLAESPAAWLRVYLRGVLASAIDPGAFRCFDLLGTSTGSRPGWWTAVRLAVRGEVGHALDVVGALGWFRALAPLVLGLWVAGLWTLAAKGWLTPACRPWRGVALGLVAYLLLMAGGPAASARFRAPAVPVLAILAGLGVGLPHQYGRSHPRG